MIISELQLDALKELINIGVGRSTSSLNQVLGKKIKLKVPHIEVVPREEIKKKVVSNEKDLLSVVKMQFKGDMSGISELVFPIDGGIKIVSLLTNKSTYQESIHDSLKVNVLSEIGNMILNALIGTLGNLLKVRVRYSVPRYEECCSNELIDNVKIESQYVIYAETLFSVVQEGICGSFVLFLEIGSFNKLLHLLNNYHNIDQ